MRVKERSESQYLWAIKQLSLTFFLGGGELNFIYSDITKIDRIKVTVEAEPLSV